MRSFITIAVLLVPIAATAEQPNSADQAPELVWNVGDLEADASTDFDALVKELGVEDVTGEPAWWEKIDGAMRLEGRAFPRSGATPNQQEHASFSIAGEPRFAVDWAEGRQRLAVELFGRLDQTDARRTHWDVRELEFLADVDAWQIRVGVTRVFWGVTEAVHLVDIINQTDLVENPDGEDKLGQPMASLAWRGWDSATLELFLMPYFRARPYPGRRGRLRPPFVVVEDRATYDSSRRRGHLDAAARWTLRTGPWDVGLSYFYGTSREPQLRPILAPGGTPRLAPHYDLIHQGSTDVQLTLGAWALKLEALVRAGQGETFVAATGGFEYTLGDIARTGVDVGLLGEYVLDDRDNDAPTLFDHDAFAGLRVAANDAQDTQLLAGGLLDVVSGAWSVGVEASRRLGDSFTLAVEGRWFASGSNDPASAALERDGYLMAELGWYF